jgi:hypothetical protein
MHTILISRVTAIQERGRIQSMVRYRVQGQEERVWRPCACHRHFSHAQTVDPSCGDLGHDDFGPVPAGEGVHFISGHPPGDTADCAVHTQ